MQSGWFYAARLTPTAGLPARRSAVYEYMKEREGSVAVQQPLRILCLLPHVDDSRIALRIELLQQAGFRVEAAAFDTRYFPERPQTVRVESLGRLRFKQYYFRVIEVLLRLPRIRAAMRRNDIVYAFWTDMGLAAALAGLGLAKPVVLEVHDIKRLQVERSLKGWLARLADRYVNRACALLVITSANYRRYYRDRLKAAVPSMVIENKVAGPLAAAVHAKEAPESAADPPAGRPLRIGYFGLLKDEWSMRVLEALAAAAPDRFRVVLAGMPFRIEDLLHRVAQRPNMEYRGPYLSPDALEELYAGIDLALACYPPELPGGWAQSNRYYEACLFRRPLIVRAGTGDAAEVAPRRIGLVIADDDVEGAAAAIAGITPDQVRRWQANMAALPLATYAYTDEADRLCCALRAIAGAAATGATAEGVGKND